MLAQVSVERRFRGFPLKTAAIAIALAMTVTGVASVLGPAAAEDPAGDVLRMGFLQKVDSLNPNVGLTDVSYIFYGLVYDGLQSVGNDLESVGNLAVGWSVAEEYEPYGSVWEFDLTQNAFWHDGEPLTADDVVFTLNLNADYYTTMWSYQPYAYFIDYAEKINDYSVRVFFFDRVTHEPMPAAYADSLYIPILPEHLLSGLTPTDISFNWEGVFESSDPPLVGTGPFMATEDIYDEYLQGDQITLVKNPDYHWAADKPGAPEVSFDGIEMHFFDDATAMRVALETDHIDVARLPSHEYYALKEDVISGEVEDIETFHGPRCDQYFTHVLINQNNAGPNPSRLDPVVRQAMAMATDKEYIVDNFYLGMAEEGSTLISSVNDEWHYEPTAEELYEFDLEAAADLLEDGGYCYPYEGATVRECTAGSYAVQQGLVPEGTPLSYEMYVRQEAPEEKDIAMFLQYRWASIGIELEYSIVTELALGAMVYGYAYDTAIWCWSSDPDPNYMLFCQSKCSWNGWSDNMYSTPEYEENYTRSVQEFDLDLRNEYVDNCQRAHYLDVPYIIFAYPYQTYAWRTDRFSGWGDWADDPGRSIDAFWGANPLYFDLVAGDTSIAPTTYITLDGTEGDNGWFVSDVTVTLDADDDSTDLSPPYTSVTMDGVPGDNGWFVSDVTVTLDAFDICGVNVTYYAVDGDNWTEYTGGFVVSGDGMHTVYYYSVDLAGNEESARSRALGIDTTPPDIEIDIVNGTIFESAYLWVNLSCSDAASGVDGCEYSLDGDDYVACNDEFIALDGLENGAHELTVVAFDFAGNSAADIVTFYINASGGEPPGARSVDYLWYDMFGHPLGPWYEDRELWYGDEWTVTDSYPYLYMCEGPTLGDTIAYTFMRLDIVGRNMTELNMMDNPEFLPFFGVARGGNAEIDWHMDYITRDEGNAKLGPGVMAWYDGWFISLNGSVVLDKQAAKAVLGVSDSEFDDFATWWSANGVDVQNDWIAWLSAEGNERLQIFNMYWYDLAIVYFVMDAQKVGNEIIVSLDTISWGMEALMARWLHEAFMPTEWYMEDMSLHAMIGPQAADLDLDAAVAYSVFAYESPEDGSPCWAWEAMRGDIIESSPAYPYSDFDPYADFEYLCCSPCSDWYNDTVGYDYTPGAWNLSENETLTFEWPEGEQLFLVHDSEDVGGGTVEGTLDLYANMTVTYAEPMPSDAPGMISVDYDNRRISYEGPFDMWTWSNEQTEHDFLGDEWDRLGLLPYGMPYVVFSPEEPTMKSAAPTGAADPGTTATILGADYTTGVNWTGYRLDGGEWQTYTSPFVVSGDGVHVLEFYSDDIFGNEEDVQTVEIKIDATDPEITMDTEDGAEFDSEPVNISWSCDDECSGVVSVEYRLDGGSYLESDDTYVLLTGLSVGSHNLSVRVTDEAGNDATATAQFTVEEPPVTNEPPVADAGVDQTVTVGDEVTFDGAGSSDDAAVVSYTWTFEYDGAPEELTGTSPSFTFDIVGEYTVTLTVEDAEGETDTDTMTVTVEEEEEEPVDDDDDKSFIESYGLPIALLVVIIVAVIVALMVMKGRKGGKSPEASTPPEE